MSSSDQSELCFVLSELWKLLDTIAAVPPNKVTLPPADTGSHPPSKFNPDAARAGGFTEEAITVLASLPYLQYPLEIQPSTSPRCFLGAELDRRVSEETRDMVEDDPIAGSVIVLTEELHRQWQHSRGLEKINLECGWRPDQVDQSAFRRDEFLEKRRRYLFG